MRSGHSVKPDLPVEQTVHSLYVPASLPLPMSTSVDDSLGFHTPFFDDTFPGMLSSKRSSLIRRSGMADDALNEILQSDVGIDDLDDLLDWNEPFFQREIAPSSAFATFSGEEKVEEVQDMDVEKMWGLKGESLQRKDPSEEKEERQDTSIEEAERKDEKSTPPSKKRRRSEPDITQKTKQQRVEKEQEVSYESEDSLETEVRRKISLRSVETASPDTTEKEEEQKSTELEEKEEIETSKGTTAKKGRGNDASFYEAFLESGTCEVASRTRVRQSGTPATITKPTYRLNIRAKAATTEKKEIQPKAKDKTKKPRRTESESQSSSESGSRSSSVSESESSHSGSFAEDSSDEDLNDLKKKYEGPTKMRGNRVKSAAVKKNIGFGAEVNKMPEQLIGKLVAVYWTDVKKTFVGIVKSWDKKKKRHTVYYPHDKETVKHNLRGKEWHWCPLEYLYGKGDDSKVKKGGQGHAEEVGTREDTATD